MQTSAGLIAPGQNDNGKSAALNHLISPLANLNSRNKSGTIEIDIKAGQSFGAVLLTKGDNAVETALYPITDNNPKQGIQFLNFGRDDYGIEGLAQSWTAAMTATSTTSLLHELINQLINQKDFPVKQDQIS